jgi:hypothetical protein
MKLAAFLRPVFFELQSLSYTSSCSVPFLVSNWTEVCTCSNIVSFPFLLSKRACQKAACVLLRPLSGCCQS